MTKAYLIFLPPTHIISIDVKTVRRPSFIQKWIRYEKLTSQF